MKDFHPHDGIALPIRNIGVFPRLIFKHLSMSFHYKGFKRCSHLYFNLSLLIRSHTTLTTRHFLFRQSTILKFGCTDRIWTCIPLINSQVDCQVSHGTIIQRLGSAISDTFRTVWFLQMQYIISNICLQKIWNDFSLLRSEIFQERERLRFFLRGESERKVFRVFNFQSSLWEWYSLLCSYSVILHLLPLRWGRTRL